MDTVHRAEEILATAERRMRELMVECVAMGDYNTTLLLTQMAKELAEMNDRCAVSTKADAAKESASSNPKRKSLRLHARKRNPASTARSSKRSRKMYPLFQKDHNSLIKIGWSKKKKDEYQHKAPRRVAELLVALLVEKGHNQKVLSSEQLVSLRDSVGDSEVPNYQAYLALAWLRQCGLIQQKGRQGYLVANTLALQHRFEEEWAALPST